MSSADGIDKVPKLPPERPAIARQPEESKQLPKSAEDYVAIANRLAAHREKPTPSPQLDSIFDQLRGRLPK
jgi:hypothetical protein